METAGVLFREPAGEAFHVRQPREDLLARSPRRRAGVLRKMTLMRSVSRAISHMIPPRS